MKPITRCSACGLPIDTKDNNCTNGCHSKQEHKRVNER